MTEFELIRTYFASQSISRADVHIGIGDDAAFVTAPAGSQTVVTTDVLVAGIHFFEDIDPEALGHKSLAVNLSDLAACGAEPAWFLLNLTMPRTDEAWLRRFAEGMFALAQRYDVQLIGGDTSRGPLSIGITAIGAVPYGKGLLRSGAHEGDAIYVTGTLGDAALALAVRQGELSLGTAETVDLARRLERPAPRVAEGIALREVASSAIDISDGLLADLSHILQASGVGARVMLESIPLTPAYRTHLAAAGWDHALAGGDDYEICFTASPDRFASLNALAAERGFVFTRIGEIIEGEELDIRDRSGAPYSPRRRGHDHFG